jgi:hypothetical protein
MLFGLRSMVLFSALTVASALGAGGDAALPEPNPAEPVVTPGSRLDAGPEDCAAVVLRRRSAGRGKQHDRGDQTHS